MIVQCVDKCQNFDIKQRGGMKNNKILQQNQKLLIEAFTNQHYQAYDDAFQKLEVVGNNLIEMIDSIEKNSQFYMRVMPIMKQQRELISEHDYKEFMNKNQKTLSKSFQKNAYLALLMQEMQEKNQQQTKKWSNEEEQALERMVLAECSYEQVISRFSQYDTKEVRKKYFKCFKRLKKGDDKKQN